MGRALLLIVAVIGMVSAMAAFSDGFLSNRQASEMADSEAETIARNAAASGFAIAKQGVNRDFDMREDRDGVSIDAGGMNGTYNVSVQDGNEGAVNIQVEGHYGEASHTIVGEVMRTLEFPAAIVVHAEGLEKAEFKDEDFLVDGTDHLPTDAVGSLAPSRPAIVSTKPSIMSYIQGELDAIQLPRFQGESPTLTSITNNDLKDWIFLARDEAHESTTALRYEKFEPKDEIIGSPDAPVVVVAEKVKLKEGSVGYGLLLIEGKEFVMERDARWEGLIIFAGESNETSKMELKDDATIVGGLILLGTENVVEEEDNVGLPGGHFDLDFFRSDDPNGISAGVNMDRDYHQHEYDDKYDLTGLDFMDGPDIKESFSDFRSAYAGESLTIRSMNEFNASGTYYIEMASGVIHTGVSRNGFNLSGIDPDQIREMRFDFTSLLELRGSNPGRVKSDAGRDRSFAIQFYKGGRMVYEVSAYEHAKELRDGITAPSGGSSEGEVVDTAIYGLFEMKVEKFARVLYSHAALTRLADVVTSINQGMTIETRVLKNAPTSP